MSALLVDHILDLSGGSKARGQTDKETLTNLIQTCLPPRPTSESYATLSKRTPYFGSRPGGTRVGQWGTGSLVATGKVARTVLQVQPSMPE